MHGLHWPEEVLSYVVVALAAGFPIVVSPAWIFDVKAGHIERTGPAQGGPFDRRTPRGSRLRRSRSRISHRAHSSNHQLQGPLVAGGRGGRGPWTATVMRPAIMIVAAMARRTGQRTSTRSALRRSAGSSGQAAIPENIANQPFVSGQGPSRSRRRSPPPPASSVQPHAATTATVRRDLRARDAGIGIQDHSSEGRG